MNVNNNNRFDIPKDFAKEAIDVKNERIALRLAQWMVDKWNLYAISIGYNSISQFIRDCVNGIIDNKVKPYVKIKLNFLEKNKNGL